MKRLCLIVFLCFVVSPAFAGPERTDSAEPQLEDWGNKARDINVVQSTSSVVLISSAPTSASLGTSKWRFREIINTANGSLQLKWNSTDAAVFSSTYGVVLATATNGMGGGSYKFYGDAPVYGIWNPSTTSGGAGGVEHYWK